MNKEQSLNFEDVDLNFGQIIQIHPNAKDLSAKCDCLIVGCLPEEAFIVSAPPSTGRFPKLSEGQTVGIRVMSSSGVALFLTTVLFISDVPAYMVYLDIPKEVKFHRVRETTRIDVSLPVLLASTVDPLVRGVSATVLDISVGGAKCHAERDVGEIGSEIEITGKFRVGAIKRLLRIKAILCSKTPVKSEGFEFGVKFCEGDEDNLLVLFGFIFNSMAFGNAQTVS